MQTVSAFRKIIGGTQSQVLHRLNLGCGLRKEASFVNIDRNPDCDPDQVHDITHPLPYPDSSCSHIIAYDVLEHLLNPKALIKVVNECHRLLVPDGLAVFRSPNVLSRMHPEWAWGDPTHRLYFCEHTWHYFQEGHEQYETNGRLYGIRPWRVQTLLLEGDGIVQATLEPVKGERG